MRLSIRTRLFLTFGGLILFFTGFSIFLNSQYLGHFYTWQKKRALIETQSVIVKHYNGNPTSLTTLLETLEINKGISVTFLSKDYKLIYSSFFRIHGPFHDGPDDGPVDGPDGRPIELPGNPLDHNRNTIPMLDFVKSQTKGLSPGGYYVEVVNDPDVKRKFIVLTGRLKNNEILILNTPIARLDESATIANQFFMITALITILLGGLFVYIFSRKITKPILDLSAIANKMSKLDFSEKYNVTSEDEIGQLGTSINSLSEQLGSAITELTEANAKLQSDIDRERRLEKMRKEFVSGVSHELKTPISLIQGYAEGLKLNVSEDQESREFYCDVIIDESEKMNRLVLELLDLSQMESGYMKLNVREFDLVSLVNAVTEKFRPLLTEKEIRFDAVSPEELMVIGDVNRIEQVIVNLLNNAINHVNFEKTITITTESKNGKALVSVYNSGSQIPEESIEKLWNSFYKIDPARTRAYGGTGLGLSIVRAIMDLHHNSYGVQNLEKGVSFWFELDSIH